jgi:hypothetical protein
MSLAIGMSLVTAVFSVVDPALLTPDLVLRMTTVALDART